MKKTLNFAVLVFFMCVISAFAEGEDVKSCPPGHYYVESEGKCLDAKTVNNNLELVIEVSAYPGMDMDRINDEYDSLVNLTVKDKEQKKLNKFLNELFAKLWYAGRYVDKNRATVEQNIGGLCRIGLLLGFALFLVQLLLDYVNNVLGQGVHPMRVLQKNIARVLLVAILLTPSIYLYLVVDCVGGITDAIAGSIMKNVLIGFKDHIVTGWGGVTTVWGAVAMTSATVGTLLSGIIYIFAIILNMIFPLLQSLIFMLAMYIGPLCIPFMLFDATKNVATNWFSFLLTISFMSVIASLAVLTGGCANVYGEINNFGAAVQGAINIVLSMIYGILSLVLICLSYPISAAIFGNAGGVGSMFAFGAVSGGVVAGGAVIAGAGAKVASKVAGGHTELGGKLSSFGDSAFKLAKSEASRMMGRGGGSTPGGGGNTPGGGGGTATTAASGSGGGSNSNKGSSTPGGGSNSTNNASNSGGGGGGGNSSAQGGGSAAPNNSSGGSGNGGTTPSGSSGSDKSSDK